MARREPGEHFHKEGRPHSTLDGGSARSVEWAPRAASCACTASDSEAAARESRNFAAVAGVPNSVDGKLSMIFAKIAFWEIVSAKINLGLEWC